MNKLLIIANLAKFANLTDILRILVIVTLTIVFLYAVYLLLYLFSSYTKFNWFRGYFWSKYQKAFLNSYPDNDSIFYIYEPEARQAYMKDGHFGVQKYIKAHVDPPIFNKDRK